MQMPLQLEESNWKSIDFQIDYLDVCQNEDSKLGADPQQAEAGP